jgi:hypothetical protein
MVANRDDWMKQAIDVHFVQLIFRQHSLPLFFDVPPNPVVWMRPPKKDTKERAGTVLVSAPLKV